MADLTYVPDLSNPNTGFFVNEDDEEQAPADGDSLTFGPNGGTPYTFTVPADFPAVAVISLPSDDATVLVPGGQTLTATEIDIGNPPTGNDGGNLVLGEDDGDPDDTTVLNVNTLNLVDFGQIAINDTATINATTATFAAPSTTPSSQFGVSIAEEASLFFNFQGGGLDDDDAPDTTWTNNGELIIGGTFAEPTPFRGLVNDTTGSGLLEFLGILGGPGQTVDTTAYTRSVIFGSENVFNGTTSELVTSSIVNSQIIPGINFVPEGVVLNGCTILSSLTLTTGQSIQIENGLFGSPTITDIWGTISSLTPWQVFGVVVQMAELGQGSANGNAVLSAADAENLFSAEFVNTTFEPNSPITVTGNTVFDATGGTIVLDDQTQVSDATAQFNGTLSLDPGGQLSAVDGASVTVQTDIVNNGLIFLAGAGSLLFESSSVTQPGAIQFSGAGNAVNFDGIGATATLIDFGDSDSIDIGSNFGGNSDFGTNSTSELTGNVLDVLNNDSAVIAAFTLESSDGFSYAQSDFSVLSDDNGGTVLFTSGVTDVSCFATGTRILTTAGEVPVEQLREGDFLPVRSSDGPRPIVWIGRRRVDCRRHPSPEKVWPVRVRAGAFGDGLPRRDLFLSPDHAVLFDGALIPVRYLINGATIVQQVAESVGYWHVELARHDAILAEGLPCESFLDTGNRDAFANGAAAVRMHADFSQRRWDADACAPLVIAGPLLERAHARLRERAELGATAERAGLVVHPGTPCR